MTTERITDDLDRLLALLPAPLQVALESASSRDQLLEVVLDLGRVPEARYPAASPWGLPSREELLATLNVLVDWGDNEPIERTLHRISIATVAVMVGLTCRVGRAVFGTGDCSGFARQW